MYAGKRQQTTRQEKQVTNFNVRSRPHRPATRSLLTQTLGNQAAQRFAQACPLRLPNPGACPFGNGHLARIQRTCPVSVQTNRISQVTCLQEPRIQRQAEDEPAQTESPVAGIALAGAAAGVSRACPTPTKTDSTGDKLVKDVEKLTDDEKIYFFTGQPDSLKPQNTTSGTAGDTAAVDNVLDAIKKHVIDNRFDALKTAGNTARKAQPKKGRMPEIKVVGTPHRTASDQAGLYPSKFKPFKKKATKVKSTLVKKWTKKLKKVKKKIKKGLAPLGKMIDLVSGGAIDLQALDDMVDDMIKAFVETAADVIIKAKIKEAAVHRLRTSTVPGLSRHHWGTDLDITSVTESNWTTPKYLKLSAWLECHAPYYGFFKAFTDDPSRGGHKHEPWHYSYLPISKPLLGILLGMSKTGYGTTQAGTTRSYNELIAEVAIAELSSKGKRAWKNVLPYAIEVFKDIDYTEFIKEIEPELLP